MWVLRSQKKFTEIFKKHELCINHKNKCKHDFWSKQKKYQEAVEQLQRNEIEQRIEMSIAEQNCYKTAMC